MSRSLKLDIQGISKFTLENFSLKVMQGEILTLLGQSGSGKTTLLKLISGLTEPSSGSIKIDDQIVCNENHFLLPEKRKIGMVFQNHGLFPHLSVADNICFGLHKIEKKERQSRLNHMAEITRLTELLKRYPHQLSGGEQQRVALARAMITKPSLILFDEPFSNLDEHLRESLRKEIKEILKENGETAIFVAHDQKDALSISDRIALIHNGQIAQVGTPQEIYTQPQTRYVAEYFGRTNLIEVSTKKDAYSARFGDIKQSHSYEEGKKGLVAIRPQWCLMNNDSPVCRGEVVDIVFYGLCQEVTVKTHQEDLFIHLHRHEQVSLGDEIGIEFDPPELKLFPF